MKAMTGRFFVALHHLAGGNRVKKQARASHLRLLMTTKHIQVVAGRDAG
jgi:hypothetical protein